ncbi:MAG: hypothetical protein ACE5GW_05370 [Planctomycetota bacterium]
MMRTLGVTPILLGTLFWSSPVPLEGQATPHGDVIAGNALRISLSGEMKLNLVARNRRYFKAALGDAITGAAGLPLGRSGGSTGNGGEVILDPQVTVGLQSQLADEVYAMIELETPFNVFNDTGGSNSGTGTSVTGRRFIEVEQAYVRWEDALTSGLTLKFGVQDFVKDFAGNGNPFLLDISHSESPFGNPTAGSDFGSPQSSSSGLVGSQEASGLYGRYDLGRTAIDAFYFTIAESFRENDDDVIFGSTLEHEIEAAGWNGKVGAVLYALQNDGASYMWTWGGGGSMTGMNGELKVYGEAYTQFGEYLSSQPNPPLNGRRILQRGAFAVYGGARYNFGVFGDLCPYIEASYWEISGDDNGANRKNDNWVSFENNNDTLVLEDGYYGLDIDSNYRAIKIRAGINPTEAWTVEALYAYLELQDNDGTADNTTSRHSKLGDEFDISARFRATDYLNFRLATGWVIDSKALGVRTNMSVTMVQAEVKF